jgi:pyridoxine 5-phosphate synthase
VTKLSININKIATLRNSRGGNMPNLTEVATDVQRFGGEGITIHPRPDQRHIRRQDVYDLKSVVSTEYNIEGYPSNDFIELVLSVKPTQVTLVPDPPGVLTSNAGWDTIKHLQFLKEVISRFKNEGIRTSLFVSPEAKFVEGAAATGSDRIELYTEAYAKDFQQSPETAIRPYVQAAHLANALRLGINAGHDLNLQNLNYFYSHIPDLLEVSIGHALICDALYLGLENTVQLYLRCLKVLTVYRP